LRRTNLYSIPIPTTDEEAEKFVLDWMPYVEQSVEPDIANDMFMIASVELPRNRPDLAWKVITGAIERATDSQSCAIGSGALENLLSWHPEEYLPRAERLALESRRFRIALEDVWQFDMPEEFWNRLQAFRSDHPL
jgi:hypothetical protein